MDLFLDYFDDPISNWDSIAFNVWIIVDDELLRIWKEVVVA
jgi:hypothetical protein